MATATKTVPSRVPGEPGLTAIDGDAHRAEKQRIKAEIDARRELMLKNCNPTFAAAREYEKPVYEWTVTAEWFGDGENGPGFWGPETRKVQAQNENHAWSEFCDAIGHMLSPRDAKRTIKRGRQVSHADVIAAAVSGTEVDAELPHYSVTPKKKSRKL